MKNSAWKEVVVTPHLLGSNKALPKGATGVRCKKCKAFHGIGKKVMRHRKANSSSTDYYCLECYDSLWI